MIRFLPKNIQWVPTNQILNNNLTLFTQNFDYTALIQSVKQLGITNPLILKPLDGGKLQIVCGNRRAHVAKKLTLKFVPAWLISQNVSEIELIRLNLTENQRNYSDIERGSIITKLVFCKTSESSIIKEYMPLIGLERSKNLFDQYLCSAQLEKSLQKTLYELNIPIRIYSICFRWKPNCQKAIENILVKLRPGVNKVQFLLETLDEIGRREGTIPENVLSESQISLFLDSGENKGTTFNKIYEYLFQRRFPELERLKTNVSLAKDKLNLSNQIKIKTSSSFENDEIHLEIKFSNLEEIINCSNNLSEVARSEAMKTLINLFKSIKQN